jgi:hypothetical protein
MDYKDSIVTGLILGLLTPLAAWFIVKFGFDLLGNLNTRSDFGSTPVWRTRTLALVALCFNLVPFQIAKMKRYDKTLRGIVFPTIIYVAIWFLYFKGEFLGASY